MEPSIFTKIIRGEIPCHKIYEDEHTLAFLDIHPVRPGHTLVIPKVQVDHLWDLDDATYAAVMASVKKVAKQLQAVLQPKRVGVHVEGFDVPHAHVHVVPINSGFEDFSPKNSPAEPDHTALAAMAEKVRLV